MNARAIARPRTLIAALFIAALAAAPLTLSRSASAQAAPSAQAPARAPTTISTNGTAKVYRTPDYLDVHVGVVVSATKAGEAQDAAMSAMEKSIAAVKALNLPGVKLQTGDVRLTPQYEDPSRVPWEMRPIIGYSAAMTVRVRTDDVKATARIIDAALANGANRVEGLNFGIHEAIEAREEAIRLAAKAAKRKAKVLAESLDVRTTRLTSVTSHASIYGGWYGGHNAYQNSMVQMTSRETPSNDDGDGAIEPGQIAIHAEVNVAYEAE